MVVALAAVTVSSLATSAEARGRGYGCGGGFPDIGYLPPNFSGGSHSPRVVTRAVVVHCTDHPYVVWRHCDVNRCR
jgi:hypothetical protein